MENGESPKYVPDLSELDLDALRDRELLPFPFWDGREWHNWANFGGRWVNIKTPAFEGLYLAAKPSAPEDLDFLFIDLLFQRATWRQVLRLSGELTYHMRTFATSAAKVEHYFGARRDIGEATLRFVELEVERLFISARRGYDLLQECVAKISARVNPRGRKLKSSFARIVLKGDDVLDSEAIAISSDLPPAVAAAYARHAPTFKLIRDRRDKIVHGLHNGFHLGITKNGFTIDPEESEVDDFAAWSERFQINDYHYSLKPLLGVVFCALVKACDDILQALATSLALPAPLAPRHRFYLTAPDSPALSRWINAATSDEVWWE